MTLSLPAQKWSTPFGAQPLATGSGTRFRLWAPSADSIGLELIDAGGAVLASLPMPRAADGWHTLDCPEVGAGQRYRYRVRPDLAVPDPASRYNPDGVHGPSQVVDPRRYRWRDHDWRGRAWEEAVIYELHVGTFTPEGRFDTAAAKLPLLRESGINLVELMPVAAFSGARNWGYDGVLPFAPDPSYGQPDDLKAFVDAAHALGIGVLLDVVYNHFGPDGNYVSAYAPEFFNPRHQTPWGAAINFDGPHSEVVRRFFVDNACHWLTEFHLDGLRLDAVHAIRDESDEHVVFAIVEAARRYAEGRLVHVVLENEHNLARLLAREPDRTPVGATAQWNDDIHHAAHVIATGETESYYRDYAEQPVALLARGLAEGFIYQGQPSRLRDGAPRGEPSTGLAGTAFVAFLQNHDQIGNRPLGDRLDAMAPTSRVEALLACLLLAPQVPMLFMGEEFAATTPFRYFCDAPDGLAQAIREGRRAEFAGFTAFRDPAQREAIPDPNDVATFHDSKLDWRERESPRGRRRREWIGRLLAARRAWLQPRLAIQQPPGSWVADDGAMMVRWTFSDGSAWILRANLGGAAAMLPAAAGETVALAWRAERHGDRIVLQPDGIEAALIAGRAR